MKESKQNTGTLLVLLYEYMDFIQRCHDFNHRPLW